MLKTWLSRDYLWNTVRQEGGAYGCFVQFSHVSGNCGLVSYRDPQVAKTYRVYAELPKVIEGLTLSRPALEQLIIGAYASVNPHQGPAGQGAAARNRYLSGVTAEFLGARIDSILGTDLAGLRAYATLFAEALQGGAFRVSIGNADKIRQAGELFARTTAL